MFTRSLTITNEDGDVITFDYARSGGYGRIIQNFESPSAPLEGSVEARGLAPGAWVARHRPAARRARVDALLLARNAAEAETMRAEVEAVIARGQLTISWVRAGVPVQIEGTRSGPIDVEAAGGLFDTRVIFEVVCGYPYIQKAEIETEELTTTGVGVVNSGSADAYWVVEVPGPSSGSTTAVTITNKDTGEELAVEGISLGPGETLFLETGPHERIHIDGSSVIDKRTASSVFWKLAGGKGGRTTEVSYAVTGDAPASPPVISYRSTWV